MIAIDATPRRQPRKYQIEGAAWLHGQRRAFLTDGFGLGKTSQAIWAAETPALIACPLHLIPHWVREIQACRPDAVIRAADGQGLARRQAQLNGTADFYVCNTELLRMDMPRWFVGLRRNAEGAVPIRTFIVDEAHRLRGRTSRQGLAANTITQMVDRVYFLTATPVYNQPDDLYWPLHMLDPKRFTSYYAFCREYLKVLETSWGPRVIGLKKDRTLKRVFAEYALGRSREDVKAQLPVLQETVIEVEADKEFYAMYEKTRHTFRDRYDKVLMSKQSIVVALRALTQQAKAQAVVQLVLDSGADSTLIYTYHRDLAFALGHLLKWPVITGNMPATKREAVARAHNTVVATFPSVAEGVDFSHMQNVIYVEHDWVPGMMQQSLNRVHRPSSPHSHTNVYHILVKKSVDAVIYRAFKKRGLTLDEIVEAALEPFVDDDLLEQPA